MVELTTSTLQVIRVDAGTIALSRNAALDNKAILELMLNEVASEWQTAGWSAGIGGFLPATSWHLVGEEQVRAVGTDATLGALAGSLPHGFAGDLVVAGCSAGRGAPVEAAGENRWLVAVAPDEGLTKLLAPATERCKLSAAPVGPGVLDHIGAIARLLRATGQPAVALWELGLDRSHLFLVTANGVEAVVPCEVKLTDIWETIRAELNLKYQLAAARLFYGDLFDFSDAAPRVAGQLSAPLSAAFAALPVRGDKPALACAGLTGTQNWLVNHLAATLGTTNWQPDPEAALAEFGLSVGGDLLPGQLAPATFGLLHRAAVNAKGGNAWKPLWHPATAAAFKFALPSAPKPAPAPAAKPAAPIPAPKPTAPVPAPKPAPAPTPVPAPKPALKAPTPVPRPAQPTPTPVPAKPAQPAPAPVQAAKPPQQSQPAKPAQPTPQPQPAKPAQPTPQPAAKTPTPTPQPTKAPTPAPTPAAKPQQQAQPAKPAEPAKPTAQPQPAPKTQTPTPAAQPAKPAAQPSAPAAKKKAPIGLIVGIIAAIIIIGGGVFFFQQQGQKNAQLQQEIAAKAEAERQASAKRDAERQEELKKAQAEASRLKAEAERQAQIAADSAKKQADALAAARAAQDALARAPAVISVSSAPEGAEVSVDGSTPQITPANITNVTPGLRRVEISMPGFETVTQLVEVKGAQVLDLGTVNLQRLYGTLMLRTDPADAEYAVFPSDKPEGSPLRTGRTPASVDNLPPGDYVIKFSRQGLVPTTEHATIAGKGVVDVNSTFIVGGVSLTSNPSGAAVRMNGEYLGVTPIVRPELQPGQATFEFTLPSHEPLKLNGEITNKETLRLHAEMLHVDRIAKPSEVKSAPKILQTAKPVIPPDLGQIQGEVVISVVVTKQGTIRDIRVDKSTNPALTEPCLKAVNQWKFGPAISKAGQPVNMRISVPFKIDVASSAAQEEDQSNLPLHMRH